MSEPFPKLTAERLWVEYYRGDGFSIGRVADWSLMVVLAGGSFEYGEDGEILSTNHLAWHIDKAYAERIIANNSIFLADLSSKTFDREPDFIICSKDAVELLSTVRDEVKNGTKESLIDSELEEMLLSFKNDKEKMKANRKQNEKAKKSRETISRPWYIRIIDNPFKRFLYGVVVLGVTGIVPVLFPLGGLLCIPFFFWGDYTQVEWIETNQKHICDKCGSESGLKILHIKYRMNIPFLRRITSITYYKTYYAVCCGCTDKHMDDEDRVGLLFNMAKADSVYMKQLTKKEFEEMVKK